MQVGIEVGGSQVYSGGYDLVALATSLGVTLENNVNIEKEVVVTIEPRENEHVAAAKMLNYAHVALDKQGVVCDIDFADLRQKLLKTPAEVKGPWQFVFPNTDTALFLISMIRHTDIQNQPKWQVWVKAGEAAEGVETHDDDQFVKHYFRSIARNYLAQITGTDPDSDACKILEEVRQRIGKTMNIIKASRTRITDEERRARMVEKVKEEDKAAAPEAFEQLKAGEIDIKAFRTAIREKKKAAAAQERAAKKAATGKAPKAAGKKLDAEGQDKIAKAQAEIKAKQAQAGEPAAE